MPSALTPSERAAEPLPSADPSGDPSPDPSPHGQLRGDFINLLRGYCMGAADTVPGISGGTVALILGHYPRLVMAISHLDATALMLLRQREWRRAAVHCDLRFLLVLGLGVGAGIVSLASLMHWLLEHRMAETLSVFFGLVLASSVIVAQQIRRWNGAAVTLAVAAGAGAYWLSGLTASTSEPTLTFVFLSAMIAICAMILPGISGAFVLLLLGVYQPITGLIKQLARGHVSVEGLLTLSIFAAGCAGGLMVFSRLLRWLLLHHPHLTFAALLGLMLGSLRKLWPLQQATAETATAKFSERHWQMVSPADWPGSLWLLAGLALAACAAVLIAEQIGRRIRHRLEQ